MSAQVSNIYNALHSRPAYGQPLCNPFLDRYNSMHAKPMEVIHHLFYRLCVKQLGAECTQEQQRAMRSWTGGPKARVPQQQVPCLDPPPDAPLQLQHVLEVLAWLFTEMQMMQDSTAALHHTGLGALEKPRYLNRLQCVNAQQITAGFRNTKHRPYDMLAAIFLCAAFLPGTDTQKDRLRAYQYTFMQMYLEQCMHFDYKDKDVYAHNYVQHSTVTPLSTETHCARAPDAQAPPTSTIVAYVPFMSISVAELWLF